MERCEWCLKKPIYIKYHDEEWGVPVFDDQKLFEFILLDSFQAGLSWLTILRKREGFRKAFANFDPVKVAAFTEKQQEQLMQDENIIRNKLKIKAAVTNAQHFLRLQEQNNGFHNYIWQFVGGNPIINQRQSMKDIPATSPESDEMSKALYKEGFKFVGSTICYAFMQAAGLVNDHKVDCFRYKEVQV